MGNKKGITVVSDAEAQMARGEVGAVTAWDLRSGADHEKLRQAWFDQGLPEDWLLTLPTTETALRRAMQGQAGNSRYVRPIRGERGWAVMEEKSPGKRQLQGDQVFAVFLTDFGTLEFEGNVTNAEVKEIEAAFESGLYTLTNDDISMWLSKLVNIRYGPLSAVPLRDAGGMYFMPQPKMAIWNKIKEAVKTVGQTIRCIPAMDSASTVEWVLDGIQKEAEEFTAAIEEDLRNGLGKRAISTKRNLVEDMERKLESYSSLLGKGLDGINKRLSKLSANLQRAELTASKDKIAAMIADLV